jgi:hypothetical protein
MNSLDADAESASWMVGMTICYSELSSFPVSEIWEGAGDQHLDERGRNSITNLKRSTLPLY